MSSPSGVELREMDALVDDSKHVQARVPASSTPCLAIGKVCLTIQVSKKELYLHLIGIGLQETEQAVIKALNSKWLKEVSKTFLWNRARSWLWRPVVELGTLGTVSTLAPSDEQILTKSSLQIRPEDLEQNNCPLEVIVSTRVPSTELTAGFNRPSLIHGTQPFSQKYADVMMGSASQKTVVIGQELRKHVILHLVAVAVAASVLIGVVIGIVTKNAGNGIGCSAGIAGIISVLLVVMLWMLK
jgi:hypothetical protein